MQEMKTLTLAGQTFKVVDEDAVRITEQTLTEEQKLRARKNVGITTGTDTLSWDGNTEGRTVIQLSQIGLTYVHVSDVVLTLDDIADSNMSYTYLGQFDYGETVFEDNIFPEQVHEIGHDVISLDDKVITVPIGAVNNMTEYGTFPKAGLYFIYSTIINSGEVRIHRTRSLTIPGYTGFGPEKIDPNLLPTSMAITTSPARIGEITILANNWIGETSPYYQVVSVPGATENSQVDLTPSIEQLSVFYNKDLAFVTENEDGVVTVYAIGQKPENDYTIQVTITEVVV